MTSCPCVKPDAPWIPSPEDRATFPYWSDPIQGSENSCTIIAAFVALAAWSDAFDPMRWIQPETETETQLPEANIKLSNESGITVQLVVNSLWNVGDSTTRSCSKWVTVLERALMNLWKWTGGMEETYDAPIQGDIDGTLFPLVLLTGWTSAHTDLTMDPTGPAILWGAPERKGKALGEHAYGVIKTEVDHFVVRDARSHPKLPGGWEWCTPGGDVTDSDQSFGVMRVPRSVNTGSDGTASGRWTLGWAIPNENDSAV